MKKPTHIGLSLTAAVLLVSVLGLGNSAVAQAGGVILKPMRTVMPGTIQRMSPRIALRKHLSCKVWGTPAEFPDSVLLTNDGAAAIAAGTRVHYYVTRGGRPTGNYTFTKALRRRASVYAPLSGYSASGALCTVRFVAAPTHSQVVRRSQMIKGVVNMHHIARIPSFISGKVKLAKGSDSHPAASNACAYITVSASELSSGSSINMNTYKKPVRVARTSGDFKRNGYCEYRLTGLPLNKDLFVIAHYSGGWSKALRYGSVSSRAVGWSNPIKLTRQHSIVPNANLDISGNIVEIY